VLAWYRPDAEAGVHKHRKSSSREIDIGCARYDIPYVLARIVYPFLGSANDTADQVGSPGQAAQRR
jgi:tagatose 1,6-diphosphate aldolase